MEITESEFSSRWDHSHHGVVTRYTLISRGTFINHVTKRVNDANSQHVRKTPHAF